MVLERRTAAHLLYLSEEHDRFTISVQEAMYAATEVLTQAGINASAPDNGMLAVLWEQLRQQAQITAYQETFLVLCGVTLLALIPAVLARRSRL
jgi:hypothetical protein